jgi:transposase InsO family protein
LRIKKIRSDNGTKFKNSQIEGFLEEEGIKHEFSSPYTPQQNGVMERKNRTLLDMTRTESRLEGVNRAKLKFTKLITTTSRVSVRNIIESAREGAKQIASE